MRLVPHPNRHRTSGRTQPKYRRAAGLTIDGADPGRGTARTEAAHAEARTSPAYPPSSCNAGRNTRPTTSGRMLMGNRTGSVTMFITEDS